jgi:hypothetical protein
MNIDEQEVQRWNTALLIAIDDLEAPNEETRNKAITAGCYAEFMEVRQLLMEDAHRKFTYKQ